MCVRTITFSKSSSVTFCIHQMTRGFKLVAATLAFVFLVSGLSAFGACLRGNGAALPKCCGPLCPMMKAPSPGTEFQAKPEGSPCCNISSAKWIPASASQAPEYRWDVAPLLAEVAFTSALPIPETELRAGVPPDRSSPPLAVLCNFLI